MSTSFSGMYWTAAQPASLNVSAFRVSAMMRPATVTVTRAGFGSIVIGWLGPGSLIDLVAMALVLPAVDVNKCELCGARLKMANCGAALIHSRLTDQPARAARSAKDLVVNL